MGIFATIVGMRPTASGTIMIGGLLFTGLAVASCSSGVSRFDYPMFAASDTSQDSSLTTAAINPVPTEPVYSAGPDYKARPDQTVVKRDLPPPPQAAQPYPQPARSAQPAAPYRPVRTAAAPQPAPQAMPLPPRTEKAPAPKPAPRQVTHTVQRGDTLSAIARKHDVSVEKIMKANKLRNSRLSLNQKLIISGGSARATAPAATASTYKVRPGDSMSIIARKYGIEYRQLAKHNGLPSNAILQPGQTLKVPGKTSTQPVRVASRGSAIPLPHSKPGRSPAPASRAARPAKRKKLPERKASLPAPRPMTGNQFRWPVRGRVVSGFGAKPNGKHNDGINVAVPLGTSVKAAENGVVAYAGNELEGYGNLVLIRHANNWVSAYAHNDELVVKRGDEVRRGQIIGKAGKTGTVSQPQVHFELRKGSQPVDPLKYMAKS